MTYRLRPRAWSRKARKRAKIEAQVVDLNDVLADAWPGDPPHGKWDDVKQASASPRKPGPQAAP